MPNERHSWLLAVFGVAACGPPTTAPEQRPVAANAQALAVDTPVWELTQAGTIGPVVNGTRPMAYDSAREVSVVLSTPASFGQPIETWEWDGSTWASRAPAQSPPMLVDHALAYDAARGKTVLFGGKSPNLVPSSETWEWDGTDWSQSAPAVSPPPRWGHALAWDATRGVTVLFGGYSYSGALADTWEWDGTSWTQAPPSTSPAPRYHHALAFDPARGKTVLFGGGDLSTSSIYFDDTWEWDGTDWSNLPAAGPPARIEHALAWDATMGATILFGGRLQGPSDVAADTWIWNGSAWTPIAAGAAPSSRSRHALAFDAARAKTVLFGGTNGAAYLDDTWEWDGAAWTPRVVAPTGRRYSPLAFDQTRGETILFGGESLGGIQLDDTWTYDSGAWTRAQPASSPPARLGHGLAWDAARSKAVLFGGASVSMVLDDTWEWDGSTWLLAAASGGPPPRVRHAMTHDSARGQTVVFGGGTTSGYAADTWEWDGLVWLERSTVTAPPARSDAAFAYDAAHGRSVLFGGDLGGVALGDTWEWDGSVWTQHSPPVSPPPRMGATLAYDVARERLVLTGGYPGTGFESYDDTWEWDGAAWTPMLAAASYGERAYHGAAFDSANRRVVVFGGGRSDTWEYHVFGGACAADDDCDTGHCVDGVCCQVATCGTCEACNLASPGVCSPVVNADDTDSCGGSCDDSGTCKDKIGDGCAGGAECASGFCVDGVCCAEPSCPATCSACNVPGAEGACFAVTLSHDLDSCPEGKTCDVEGACKLDLGESCTAKLDCASGWCIDGFCCNEACTGQCEACDAPESEGTCVPVTGAPHPPRAPCPGAPEAEPCAAKRCDGVVADSCAGFADAAVLCRAPSCDDGIATSAAFCNAAGSCPAPTTETCAPLVCAADACAETCASDSDCVVGFRCDSASGVCAVGGQCDGDHTVALAGGEIEDCTPYRCAPDGKCLVACGGTFECVDGWVCDARGRCAKPPAPADTDQGSGCTAAPSSTVPGHWIAAAIAIAAWSARRRRALRLVVAGAAALVGCADRDVAPARRLLASSAEKLLSIETKLVASDPASDAWLGWSVAIDGDTAVVGAPTATGAAYVFVRNGESWIEQQKLSSDVPDDRFGGSVAVSGDTIAVGASWDDSFTGAVYVFTRTGASWSLEEKLVPPDAQSSGFFAGSVALHLDTLVAGAVGSDDGAPAAGSAYVYVRNVGTWSLEQELLADVPEPNGGFGVSVAIDGDSAVVGSHLADEQGETDAGAAFVFTRSAGVWALEQKLSAPFPVPGSSFGASVAIAGDTAVAGAPNDAGAGGWPTGAVHVFERSAGVWLEQQQLVAADGLPGDALGTSVAVWSDRIVAGAPNDDGDLADIGAAYVFERVGATWTQQQKLAGAGGMDWDAFGFAVALSDAAIVGAPFAGLTDSGAAWVFDPPRPLGAPCVAPSDCISADCSDGVCCDTACSSMCEACTQAKTGRSDGTCAAVSAATDPDGECSDDGAPACGQNGLCDGASACALYPTQSGCTPASCSLDAQCTSLHCAKEPGDPLGICCDQACTGACESCRAAVQGPGGQEGVCLPIAEATDPRQECEPSASVCEADGVCDGAGQCRAFSPAGTSCAEPVCGFGGQVSAACDGAGLCVSSAPVSCDPYACDDATGSCRTSCMTENDCVADASCAADGTCTAEKGRGASCAVGAECADGLCVDGHCCDSPCANACEACDLPAALGICSPVVGAPHGARAPCPGTGDECGARCDGVQRDACVYVEAGVSCGEAACEHDESIVSTCDGIGICSPRKTACAPFACSDGACRTECAADGDCIEGFRCDGDGACVPTAPTTDGSCTGAECAANAGDGSGCGCTTTGAPVREIPWLWTLVVLAMARVRSRPISRRPRLAALTMCLALLGCSGEPRDDRVGHSVAALETSSWELRAGEPPVDTTSHAMAYDVARGRTVLFGGGHNGSESNDLFEWDGSAWWRAEPPQSPSPRGEHALAHDAARGRTVLFGGKGPSGILGDTWEWDGSTWTQHFPAQSPSARWGHALAYDPVRGRTVLFGGGDGNGPLGDTWEWDGTTWVEVAAAPSPPPRYRHALAHDTARGRTVLFGGFDGSVPLGDTWEWDGTQWTLASPATSPAARMMHALAYDVGSGRTFLFGGHVGSVVGDVWTWDGTTWLEETPATGPAPRAAHALAYDELRDKVVLYGGTAFAALPPIGSETWEWDGAAWERRAPSNRSHHALAYDAVRAQTLLFGGRESHFGSASAETWVWDGTTWAARPVGPAPSARMSHALAYDSKRDKTVLFGGEAEIGGAVMADTWEWDGTSWAKPSIAGVSPPGRRGHALAYDAARERTVLFGGATAAGTLGDTWEWDGTTWELENPPSSPPPRAGHAMAWDATRGRTVLFGGDAAGDTWEWDGSDWTQALPAVSPTARFYFGMAYDAARGKTVLFGGTAGFSIADEHVWEWDGTSWSAKLGLLGPGSRWGNALAFDVSRGRIVAFGGLVASDAHGDTWEYHAFGGACASDSECDTGHCVDGACCQVASCGLCESCNAASPGTCSLVTGVADDTCPAPSACGPAGDCLEGNGQPCVAASECASTHCTDGVCCAEAACPGVCESCSTPTMPGVCAIVHGADDPDTCPSETSTCDALGQCSFADGQACGSSTVCASGHCVDGICCNAPCEGQCEACNLAGSEGTCLPVTGAPHSPKMACEAGQAGEPCSERTCDGIDRDTCAGWVGDTVICSDGDCDGSAAVSSSACDGSGVCPPATKTECAPFACASGSCLSSCTSDGDCAPQHRCDVTTATCVSGATCDGDHTLYLEGGQTLDCAPYRCTSGGTCREDCSSAAECATGAVCNADARCVAFEISGAATGCGCRVATPRDGSLAWPFAALSILGAAAQRRARRSPRRE